MIGFENLKVIPDPSQMDAIQHIMKNNIALIQGPPGTGKSFVGVLATRLLYKLIQRTDMGPILVICYSNHALDRIM
jgi:superfamily II DNA or RNA helicase